MLHGAIFYNLVCSQTHGGLSWLKVLLILLIIGCPNKLHALDLT